MPGRNLMPILYPKKKKEDVFDRLQDFLDIMVKGYGTAPSSGQLEDAVSQQWALCNTLSGNKRRTCIKKALDLEKNAEEIGIKEKDLGSKKIKSLIEGKLTDLEFSFPNDLYHYVDGKRILYRQASSQMNDILAEMPAENYKNYTDIQEFLDLIAKYETEAVEMNELLTAMTAQNEDALKYYGVFYKTSPAGEVKEMSVGLTAKPPTSSVRTNIKTAEGLPVFIINPKATDEIGIVQEAILGNSKFTYLSSLGRFQTTEPDKFDWDQIKHRAITSVKWGEFVKDSKGQRYFATKEGKLAPVNDDVFGELGGNENKIQKLSSWEEENILPTAMTNPIQLPTPKLEEAIRGEITAEYEREKALRHPLIKVFGMRGLFGGRPAGPTPAREEIETRVRGRRGIERYLPPKEKEAIGGRTEQIIKGEY